MVRVLTNRPRKSSSVNRDINNINSDYQDWKDIVGFEGLYQVSRFGKVRSVDRVITVERNGQVYQKRLKGTIKAECDDDGGYATVNLSGNKRLRVHRLVAITWLGPPVSGQEVCHGPNGKSDNSVNNIRWGSRTDNRNDHYADGIGNIRRVVRSDGKEYNSITDAAIDIGRAKQSIQKVCAGKRRLCGGYGWSYINQQPAK